MNTIHKIWSLLTSSEKLGTYTVFLIMVLSVLVETLGIGIIIPIVTIFLTENIVEKYPQVYPLYEMLGSPSQNTLIIFSLLSLLSVYIFKSIFLIYFNWKKEDYTNLVIYRLTKELLRKYLQQPYDFHLRKNTAILVRNIAEVGSIKATIINLLTIATEILLLIFVLSLLLYVEFFGTIIIFSLITFVSILYFYILKGKLKSLGEKSLHHSAGHTKSLLQSFGAIKLIKLFGKENNFISSFKFHLKEMLNISRFITVVSGAPRFLLELFGVLAMVLIVLSMLKFNKAPNEIISILAVFGVAGYRLIPSANRILVSMQALKYTIPSINLIFGDFKLKNYTKNLNSKSSFLFTNNIELKNVSYSYPGSENKVLKEVNIQINKGEIIGLSGTTGSGKSTLLDIILGLLPPTNGIIKIDNKNLNEVIDSWQQQIGYVSQSTYLSDESIKKNVAFAIPENNINEKKVNESLKIAQLINFIESLPNGIFTEVGERGSRLSGGQVQRIGIARALYQNPNILVLDEATNALDKKTQEMFMNELFKLRKDKTIIIVSHRNEVLNNCDKVFKVENGQIFLVKEN